MKQGTRRWKDGGSRVVVWAVVLMVVGILVGTSIASDWPQWRGPNRDGVSSEQGWRTDWPAAGPPVAWRASVGAGYSAVSVAAGHVYTMGNDGTKDTVWCLNEKTGAPVWRHSYACPKGKHPGPRMTPTADGGSVYTLSREGHLHCLDAGDGSVRWTKDVVGEYGVKQSRYKWGLASSPVVVGDLLILDLGRNLAFKKDSGELAWQSGNDTASFSSAVAFPFSGQTLVTAFTVKGLFLLDARTGKQLAHRPWATKWDCNAASPIVVQNKIFISSGYGRGCALLKLAGTPEAAELRGIYEHKKMKNHCNSSVLYEEHLYGFDGQAGGEGPLVCMELATGRVKWTEADGMKVGSLVIADGKIVAMVDGGDLLVAEAKPSGFTQLARARVLNGQCWTSPVLANGRILCRNTAGNVVSLDVSASD